MQHQDSCCMAHDKYGREQRNHCQHWRNCGKVTLQSLLTQPFLLQWPGKSMDLKKESVWSWIRVHPIYLQIGQQLGRWQGVSTLLLVISAEILGVRGASIQGVWLLVVLSNDWALPSLFSWLIVVLGAFVITCELLAQALTSWCFHLLCSNLGFPSFYTQDFPAPHKVGAYDEVKVSIISII